MYGGHSLDGNYDAEVRGQDTKLCNSKESYDSYSDSVRSWVPPLPRPPRKRSWHGSMIAPYGANIQFRLHRSEVGSCLISLPGLLLPFCWCLMYVGFTFEFLITCLWFYSLPCISRRHTNAWMQCCHAVTV